MPQEGKMSFKYITYAGASHSFLKKEGAAPDDAIEECIALANSVDRPVVLDIDGFPLFFVAGCTLEDMITRYVLGYRAGDVPVDQVEEANPRATAEIPAALIARIVQEAG
jgi:hypothetical protein